MQLLVNININKKVFKQVKIFFGQKEYDVFYIFCFCVLNFLRKSGWTFASKNRNLDFKDNIKNLNLLLDLLRIRLLINRYKF